MIRTTLTMLRRFMIRCSDSARVQANRDPETIWSLVGRMSGSLRKASVLRKPAATPLAASPSRTIVRRPHDQEEMPTGIKGSEGPLLPSLSCASRGHRAPVMIPPDWRKSITAILHPLVAEVTSLRFVKI